MRMHPNFRKNSGRESELLAGWIWIFHCMWDAQQIQETISCFLLVLDFVLLSCNPNGLMLSRTHDVWARSFLRGAYSRLNSPNVWSFSICPFIQNERHRAGEWNLRSCNNPVNHAVPAKGIISEMIS
jgi:hypothetical protein